MLMRGVPMHVNVFDFAQLLAGSPQRYSEFLRSLLLECRDLRARWWSNGSSEDEVYYVASGRARMRMEANGRRPDL